MLFCIAIWVALFCSSTDWYMHTLTILLLNNFCGQARIFTVHHTSFFWCSDSLFAPREIGIWGERQGWSYFSDSRHLQLVANLAPKKRHKVSSCFDFNRLGIEGLSCVWLWAVGAAAVAFLHPEEITAVVAAVGNNPPCCPRALGLCGWLRALNLLF